MTVIKSILKRSSALKCHFGNLGARVEWLNLGSLQTPQGHRDPPEAPAELHCMGASGASMGPGESMGHLAPADDEEVEGDDDEEEEAAEERRDSWVRRS